MAGERKGKTYEALVCVALRELQRRGSLAGEIFWNKTPTGMTIEPDFTVGPDADHPSLVFLVTHSGSAKESEKKLWRNMGELAEAKTVLPTLPGVYSIAFDALIKEDLKKVQGAAFDGQLIVGDESYGPELQRWVDENTISLPKDSAERVEAIEEAMAGRGSLPDPSSVIDEFVRDLASTLKISRPELDHLWHMQRLRPASRRPVAHRTYLKRGIGKLAICEPPLETAIDRHGTLRSGTSLAVSEALLRIGLARKSLIGIRVIDEEMLWPRQVLDTDELVAVCEQAPRDEMLGTIETLQSLTAIPDQLKFMALNWSELLDPHGLFNHLKQCHSNPCLVSPSRIPASSRRVWLFDLLIEWIKLSGRARTEFGFAVLIRELTRLKGDSDHINAVKMIIGREPVLRAGDTIRLGLTDWHSTSSKQAFALYDDDLARVAHIMSRRLSACPVPNPAKDETRLADAVIQHGIENGLMTYRGLEPSRALLTYKLTQTGLSFTPPSLIISCFAERVVASGQRLDPRSAGTTVISVDGALVNWQSVTDAGRDHKKKELCGRAVSLRYTWDASAERFIARPGVERLILIVDGTWRQPDLEALARAGWDEIYYPEEMDQLVSSIQGAPGRAYATPPAPRRRAAEVAGAYTASEQPASADPGSS